MPVVNNDEYTTLQTGNHLQLPLQTPNETPQASTQSYSYHNSMQDDSVSETQEDCETHPPSVQIANAHRHIKLKLRHRK
jgi:hypothetical protein